MMDDRASMSGSEAMRRATEDLNNEMERQRKEVHRLNRVIQAQSARLKECEKEPGAFPTAVRQAVITRAEKAEAEADQLRATVERVRGLERYHAYACSGYEGSGDTWTEMEPEPDGEWVKFADIDAALEGGDE
jgi:cell division septum initiation protein DivIVA